MFHILCDYWSIRTRGSFFPPFQEALRYDAGTEAREEAEVGQLGKEEPGASCCVPYPE